MTPSYCLALAVHNLLPPPTIVYRKEFVYNFIITRIKVADLTKVMKYLLKLSSYLARFGIGSLVSLSAKPKHIQKDI